VEALVEHQVLAFEAKAWGLINALEELVIIRRQLSAEEGGSDPRLAAEAATQARDAAELARVIRAALPRLL
jgi:hypothetical protein